MKIKDLLGFNPEAEIIVLDSKGKEVELTDVCWSANDDGRASINQKKTTKEVFIQVKTEDNKEWWEKIANEIKVSPYEKERSVTTINDGYKDNISAITAEGPSPYTVRFTENSGLYVRADQLPPTKCLVNGVDIFSIPTYQEEGIYLDSIYKIINIPSGSSLKKNIGAAVGHFIRFDYKLTSQINPGGRTRAQYINITDLTTNKSHKISMNTLTNALKHYTLERVR